MKQPMNEQFSKLRLGGPANYQIKVQGRLEQGWSDWFDDLTIHIQSQGDGPSITVLTGTVSDQVALHGLLARIRDLNLPLISVVCLDPIMNL
jgi:hypothetical protein